MSLKLETKCYEIGRAVPLGELLVQLAEECTELAKAALKLRRAAGYADNNPTPVTEDEAYEKLETEIADVMTVLKVLACFHFVGAETEKISEKLERWCDRLDL